MLRIHKAYNYLFAGETTEDFVPALAYCPDPMHSWPTSTCVVDYSLSRIRKAAPGRWQCCELEDLTGQYENIYIHVRPFDALLQVKRDIYAASRLLLPTGELRLRVPPKSGATKIGSILAEVFGYLRVAKSGGFHLFSCQQAPPQEFLVEDPSIYFHDTVSGRELRFAGRRGIFSADKIDRGTAFLLRIIPALQGKSVIDVGCGYGAIGVVAAARGADVTLIDVDARAIKLG